MRDTQKLQQLIVQKILKKLNTISVVPRFFPYLVLKMVVVMMIVGDDGEEDYK